jgi:glycine cleavage system H protein
MDHPQQKGGEMKAIEELNLPDDVRYSPDHEWARAQDDLLVVGISDYAQDQLGDIVFVELPEVGSTFSAGQEFGTVESVKAVSELFMPFAAEVVAINADLEESPELVNNTPYEGGWMVKVKATGSDGLNALMDRSAYLALLKG